MSSVAAAGIGGTYVPPVAVAAAAPATVPAPPSDPATTGANREIFDGVDLTRPFDILPHIFTNLTEHFTGQRDPRTGRALTQILYAGERFITAGLRSMSQGTGAIAAGSSILGKILPTLGIATGVMQIWRGWNELQSHDDGPFSIIHSKTGRTGLLQVLAGALLFVPGVGGALAGSLARIGSAANEMDTFKQFDWPTVPIESRGTTIARIAHPFDPTPTNALDARTAVTASDPIMDAVAWLKDHLTPRND